MLPEEGFFRKTLCLSGHVDKLYSVVNRRIPAIHGECQRAQGPDLKKSSALPVLRKDFMFPKLVLKQVLLFSRCYLICQLLKS